MVEATSGNTGIALAMVGAILHKTVIIMPESMSKERRELIKACTACILTPKETGMRRCFLERANEISVKYPKCFHIGPIRKPPANPDMHYRTTGAEIVEQVPNVMYSSGYRYLAALSQVLQTIERAESFKRLSP